MTKTSFGPKKNFGLQKNLNPKKISLGPKKILGGGRAVGSKLLGLVV